MLLFGIGKKLSVESLGVAAAGGPAEHSSDTSTCTRIVIGDPLPVPLNHRHSVLQSGTNTPIITREWAESQAKTGHFTGLRAVIRLPERQLTKTIEEVNSLYTKELVILGAPVAQSDRASDF